MTDNSAIEFEPTTAEPAEAALFHSFLADAGRSGPSRLGFHDRNGGPARGRHHAPTAFDTVTISPADRTTRRPFDIDGMTVEIVRITGRDRIEARYRGHRHLLALIEDAAHGGMPAGTARPPLTFVPVGHEYDERRAFGRVVYFYIDPAKMPAASGADLKLRLQIEDAALLDTASKIAASIESAGDRLYLKALGIVLMHDLIRMNASAPKARPPVRGGLAAWQQRAVTAYIEEHVAKPISLAELAGLARLSPWHFCRAFKESFGVPPHRYHNNRRIEHAKVMLARPSVTVTEIGFSLGFSETSAFSAAFRRTTGITPTMYQRRLT